MADIISAKCFGCGHVVKVPTALGGKKARCPQCTNTIVIPTSADTSVELIPDEQLPEVAREEDVGQAGKPVLVLIGRDLVNAADHRRPTVADDDLGRGLAGRNRRVGGANDRQAWLRRSLGDADIHHHGPLRRHLGRHLQLQGGVDELDGDRPVRNRLTLHFAIDC